MANEKNTRGKFLDIIENTAKTLRENFTSSQANVASNTATVSKMNNKILMDLDSIVAENAKKMKDLGIDNNSPAFMRNHVAEKIRDEGSIATSSVTSAAIETDEDIKTMIGESENNNINADAEPRKLLNKKKVKNLASNLKTTVFGQDHAIEELSDVLKVSALNIKINKVKPAGCYFFAGPSGVGKTELSEALARSLEAPILIIKGGEHGLEQDVTKLIGTAKGYVGYNEGGSLTNFVSENPVCVVLFDEIEKAHRSIDKLLLSIMDKGICTDNKGNDVIFKETIIICTSNLGAEVEYYTDLTKEEKNRIRMQAIKKEIRPEIIGRFDSIFQFNALSGDIYELVVNKFIKSLNASIQEEHKFSLEFTPKLMKFIVEKSYDPALGGRPASKFIEKVVIKSLSDYMLEDDFETEAKNIGLITMDINKDNNIYFKAGKKVLGVLENTAELVSRIEEGKFTNKSNKKDNLPAIGKTEPAPKQKAVQVADKPVTARTRKSVDKSSAEKKIEEVVEQPRRTKKKM